MTEQTVADRLSDDMLERLNSAENASNPIEQIKRRIDENDTTRGFSIARVPTEAHEDFSDLAENMFGDDYGMTLAFLVHYFKINDANREHVNELGDRLEARLNKIEKQLESSDDKEDESRVNTLNG